SRFAATGFVSVSSGRAGGSASWVIHAPQSCSIEFGTQLLALRLQSGRDFGVDGGEDFVDVDVGRIEHRVAKFGPQSFRPRSDPVFQASRPETLALQVRAVTGNWIQRLPAVDFFLGPVPTRISGRGVGAEPVSDRFDQCRAATGPGPG